MSANVTGGIGLHAADLLTTLKTGWLLGARPRHQVYAQLFGVLAGGAIIVPLFYLVVPVAQLGSDELARPERAGLGQRLEGLRQRHRRPAALGPDRDRDRRRIRRRHDAARQGRPRVRPFLPSPSAIGIAMVVPWSNSLAFFLGTAIAELIRRRFRRLDIYTVPVASGLIAGESLVAIAITIATTVL